MFIPFASAVPVDMSSSIPPSPQVSSPSWVSPNTNLASSKASADAVDTNNDVTAVNANFPNDYGQIDIIKLARPNYKDFYLLNKTYCVNVEIKGVGRPLDNVTIKEIVDSKLQIDFSQISPYVFDPFSTSSIKPIHYVNITNLSNQCDQYSLDYLNNSIYIKVNRLEPKHRIKYNFTIKSNETGVFQAVTILRLAGDSSKWSDLDVPLDIEVRPPIFEAYVDKETSYAIEGKSLNVTYNILHKSGWCSGPFKLNVSFKNSTDDEYELYINKKLYKNGDLLPTVFSTLKGTQINVSIIYKNSGSHILPAVLIEREIIPFEDNKVEIYQYFTKSMDESQSVFSNFGVIFAVILSLFSFFISLYELRLTKKDLRLTQNDLHFTEKDLHFTEKGLDIMYEELKVMREELQIAKDKFNNSIYNTSYDNNLEYVSNDDPPSKP
jgi:hypothetical protein